MNILIISLILSIAALQAADVYLTVKILRAGGRELNPVMRKLIETLGLLLGLTVGKLAVMAVLLAGVHLIGLNWISLIMLCFCTGLMAVVVTHNSRQIRR